MKPKTVRLDYTPRKWQEDCHRSLKRFTVLVLHRRAGKTELALMELLDKAMKCQRQLGRFAYICPFRNQARTNVWDRLKAKVSPLISEGVVETSEVDLTIRFKHNGASVILFGADRPDALRGTYLDGVVIDEVAQIKPAAWNEAIQPTLSDRLGWAIFIGTPNGINLFSELYYKAQNTEGWTAHIYGVYETDALDPAEVEMRKRDMPENSFAREYLCDFHAAAEDQLITLYEAEEASRRQYQQSDIIYSPRILGVDPARFGDDRSVIFRRQGLQAFPPQVFRGIDNMALAARVADAMNEWSPDAVFIDSGAGAGVIDRLRQLGKDVVEVPFGGKATRAELYVNKRTEMWTEMREWIVGGGAIPNDSTLKQELATPTYWFDSAGKRVLESKDDIKKRLNESGSPDLADALCLTFAHPVAARRLDHEVPKSRKRDYDPYKDI